MRLSHVTPALIGVLISVGCATEMTSPSIRAPRLYDRLTTPEGAMDALQAAFADRQCEIFAAVYDPSLVSGTGTEPPKVSRSESDFIATVTTFEEMCSTAESVEFSFTPRRVEMGEAIGYPPSKGYVTMLADDVSYRIYSPEKDECCRDIRVEGGRMLFVLQESKMEEGTVWRIVHERELPTEH